VYAASSILHKKSPLYPAAEHGVEAVEKPQMPYFIENREIYHIDY